MKTDYKTLADVIEAPSQCARAILHEQILWLIALRWLAVGGIVAAALTGKFLFPVLDHLQPVMLCAGLLAACNIVYRIAAGRKEEQGSPKDTVLAIVQLEMDLIILTLVLHFSGGLANPFFLFYLFHVILATILLPRNLSFTVGISAITLFGVLATNELKAGRWLGSYPLQLPVSNGLWRDPVYVLGAFVAFSCTVLLAQYLTRVVIVRMTAKEMEAARNQDVLSAVINAMKEGLLFLGNDGKQIFANPAAEGWKRQETHGSDDPDEGLPEVLREEMLAHASSAAQETQAPWHIEFETDSEEPRYIEAQGRPVTDVQNRRLGYVIVGRDLTERRRLEKALRERTEDVTAINDMLKISRLKMAEREKMVAVGQMAAGIAHEIGNPLASLSSVVQYLARKAGLKEEKEQLDLILSQVTRISTILRRMLSISRPASTEHCWTQVEKVIAITLSLVEFDVRMDFVTLENVPSEGLPECWLNPQSLEQVLLNVLINALDAMVARGKDRPLVLRITKAVQDDCVEVRISDNGIGMEREVAERAFESFYSTKEAGKGTGLGLFVSCNLMKEMAGEIALESEAGQGTTVILKMPIRGKKDTMQGDSDVA